MPPRKKLKVEAWPRLRTSTDYPVKVTSLAWGENDAFLAAVLTHLAEEQGGRTVKVNLSLPVRPEGRTAGFFRAAKLEVAVGSLLDPADAEGAIVLVRFDVGPDGNGDVAEFLPAKEVVA